MLDELQNAIENDHCWQVNWYLFREWEIKISWYSEYGTLITASFWWSQHNYSSRLPVPTHGNGMTITFNIFNRFCCLDFSTSTFGIQWVKRDFVALFGCIIEMLKLQFYALTSQIQNRFKNWSIGSRSWKRTRKLARFTFVEPSWTWSISEKRFEPFQQKNWKCLTENALKLRANREKMCTKCFNKSQMIFVSHMVLRCTRLVFGEALNYPKLLANQTILSTESVVVMISYVTGILFLHP